MHVQEYLYKFSCIFMAGVDGDVIDVNVDTSSTVARSAEGNTRPRWSHACEYTCVQGLVA